MKKGIPAAIFAVIFVLLSGCNQKPKDEVISSQPQDASRAETAGSDTTKMITDTKDVVNPVQTEDPGKDRKMSSNFTLLDLDGTSHVLSSYKGKVVLIDFWASWCPPCKAEIPHLVKIYEAYKNKGLVIIGVGLDKKANLAKIKAELGINYTVLVDEKSEAGRLYEVRGIPRTLILDKKGRIAADHVGFAEGMQKDLEQEITKLLAEE